MPGVNQAKFMICKLTGKGGTHAKAHIIPRSFYLLEKAPKEPLQMVTNAPGVYPKKVGKVYMMRQ
jgi:hypothetical protein